MRSLTPTFIFFGFVNQLFQLSCAQTAPACLSTCETSGVVDAGCASVADITCLCTQTFLTNAQTCFQAQCDTTADAQTALQLLQNQCATASSSTSSTASTSSSNTLTTRTRTTSTTTATTSSSTSSISTSVVNTANPNYTPPPRNIPPPGYSYTPPSQPTTADSGGSTAAAAATTPVSSAAKGLGLSTILAAVAIVAGGMLF